MNKEWLPAASFKSYKALKENYKWQIQNKVNISSRNTQLNSRTHGHKMLCMPQICSGSKIFRKNLWKTMKCRDPHLRKFADYRWLMVRRVLIYDWYMMYVFMLLASYPLLTTSNSGFQGKEACSLIQYSYYSAPATDWSILTCPKGQELGLFPLLETRMTTSRCAYSTELSD